MIDTGGGKQERLPCGAKLGSKAGKNRLAQSLGAWGAPRLARPNDGKPERGEALLEPLGLNRLARALAALERNEAPLARGLIGSPRNALLPFLSACNCAEEV